MCICKYFPHVLIPASCHFCVLQHCDVVISWSLNCVYVNKTCTCNSRKKKLLLLFININNDYYLDLTEPTCYMKANSLKHYLYSNDIFGQTCRLIHV